MKIKDLFEMPIKIGAFPEFSDEDVKLNIEKLSDAEVIEKVEERFDLVKKDNLFGLKDESGILGFAHTEIVKYFDKEYLKIRMIFVLKFARNKKIGHRLLFGIQETSNIPLICDDVISQIGFDLFNSYPFNQSLKCLDLTTGEITDFKSGDEAAKKKALVLENQTIGLWRQFLAPACDAKSYLMFFDDDHTPKNTAP